MDRNAPRTSAAECWTKPMVRALESREVLYGNRPPRMYNFELSQASSAKDPFDQSAGLLTVTNRRTEVIGVLANEGPSWGPIGHPARAERLMDGAALPLHDVRNHGALEQQSGRQVTRRCSQTAGRSEAKYETTAVPTPRLGTPSLSACLPSPCLVKRHSILLQMRTVRCTSSCCR